MSERKRRKIQEQAIGQAVNMAQEQRGQARQRGREYAQDVMSQPYEGLNPQQKLNMQENSQQGLNRQMQGYQRQLLAQQGQRGLRGGAAYAQQADLARMGTEVGQQNERELQNLDQDLALKKMAAGFNIEQGEASQSQLDRQQALDEIKMAHERKIQKRFAKKANRLFSRV